MNKDQDKMGLSLIKPAKYKNPIAKGKYRNNPCVCGSGKKIKKCHGMKEVISKDEYDQIVRLVHEFNVRFKTEYKKQAEAALKAKEVINEQV